MQDRIEGWCDPYPARSARFLTLHLGRRIESFVDPIRKPMEERVNIEIRFDLGLVQEASRLHR